MRIQTCRLYTYSMHKLKLTLTNRQQPIRATCECFMSCDIHIYYLLSFSNIHVSIIQPSRNMLALYSAFLLLKYSGGNAIIIR